MQSRLHLLACPTPAHSAGTPLRPSSAPHLEGSVSKVAHGLEECKFPGQGKSISRKLLSKRTKAGLTSTAGSITESLRRTHHMMVEEVERSSSTQALVDQLTGILKKAESEYKGHKSLLRCTHGLLSTTKRQDVTDRIILVVGLFILSNCYC